MKKIGIIIALVGVVAAQANQAFAGYFNSDPIDRCEVSITTNVKRGSENEDVIILQNFLARAGYLYATPNGYFGYQTERAVRSFQRDNLITATGVVGEATRNAINERMCDFDLQPGNVLYYGGASSQITYVTGDDPFVQVISAPSTPIAPLPSLSSYQAPVVDMAQPLPQTPTVAPSSIPYLPSRPDIVSTTIVYNPSTGYTIGIVPASGSVTVTTPSANAIYAEGDTVNVAWRMSNIAPAPFSILLENTTSGQSTSVGTTQANSFSFTLTKELLDAVCAGSCNYSNQNTYRVVVSLPVKDIAGTVSTLKAAVAPITVKRQFAYSGQVSITTSKTPVSSGEIFRLYLNIPRGASWDSLAAGNYSIRIKATCPSGVTGSIAGTSCGTDFVIPFAPVYFQQEIPASLTNTSWYRQNVRYELTVVNANGQPIGSADTNVIVNPAPFGW